MIIFTNSANAEQHRSSSRYFSKRHFWPKQKLSQATSATIYR